MPVSGTPSHPRVARGTICAQSLPQCLCGTLRALLTPVARQALLLPVDLWWSLWWWLWW